MCRMLTSYVYVWLMMFSWLIYCWSFNHFCHPFCSAWSSVHRFRICLTLIHPWQQPHNLSFYLFILGLVSVFSAHYTAWNTLKIWRSILENNPQKDIILEVCSHVCLFSQDVLICWRAIWSYLRFETINFALKKRTGKILSNCDKHTPFIVEKLGYKFCLKQPSIIWCVKSTVHKSNQWSTSFGHIIDPLVVQRTCCSLASVLFLRRATGEVNNDIVVEMKTDKANEEAGLLNKRPSTEQVRPVERGWD